MRPETPQSFEASQSVESSLSRSAIHASLRLARATIWQHAMASCRSRPGYDGSSRRVAVIFRHAGFVMIPGLRAPHEDVGLRPEPLAASCRGTSTIGRLAQSSKQTLGSLNVIGLVDEIEHGRR
jgi:hypothetical protein